MLYGAASDVLGEALIGGRSRRVWPTVPDSMAVNPSYSFPCVVSVIQPINRPHWLCPC